MSEKRRVVVTTANKEKYIGEYVGSLEDLEQGKMVLLTNVWEFISMKQITAQGLGLITLVAPVDTAMDALKELHVLPVTWYDDETVNLKKDIDKFIEQAKEQLKVTSAKEAGLTIPSRGNSSILQKKR